MTRAFVLLGGGRPEERGRRHQERLMAGVGGKAASLGAGSRPSPEMLPHPWHQPPPWVWLGPPAFPCFGCRETEVEVKGRYGGQ